MLNKKDSANNILNLIISKKNNQYKIKEHLINI